MFQQKEVDKIENHLWLVKFLLHRWKYVFPGTWEELKSVIYEGICKAADTDDPKAETKFSTYATVVTENLIKKEVKKRRRTQNREIGVLDLDPREGVKDEGSAFDYIASTKDTQQPEEESRYSSVDIVEAMVARTDLQRDIFQSILDHPELSPIKIAEENNCHPNEVRRLLRRVRGTLLQK